jgi:serine/threonine-protein kinase
MEISYPHVVIMALAAIIVSPIILSYVYSTYIVPVPEMTVPNVSNMALEGASAKLDAARLSARIAERAYEKDVPKGWVISQRPEAGRRVKVGRVINLKVSIGERTVPVPNLVGRPLSQIEAVLSEAGLKIGDKRIEYDEHYQSGTVVSQTPLPDSDMPVGSDVDVVVAENPNFGTVAMPNLVSKTVEEAKGILSDIKLKPITYYHETKEFKEGVVLSQDPIEGEEVRMGDTVKIYVSKTPTGEGGAVKKYKNEEE